MNEQTQITYEKLNKDIEKLASIIKKGGVKYTSLYPIPRGGVPIAFGLSAHLRIPLVDNTNDPMTLVVDDLVDSGKTLEAYANSDSVALYAKPYSPAVTSYDVVEVIEPKGIRNRLFEAASKIISLYK